MINLQPDDLNRGESLPHYYGVDRLVVLPRDPYCLYTYWEVSLPTRESLKNEWGEAAWQGARLQLRVHKHDWNREEIVESFFDVTLETETDNWYLPALDSDRVYHTELGWRLPDGDFKPVLRSNAVRTPRDGLSDIIDEEWQLPDWKARRLFRRISLYHLSSPELFRRRKQRQ
ncbi:MAG: DUF4912 domain-containing protein [Bacillota bacterium]